MLQGLKKDYKRLLIFFLLFGLVKSSVLIAPLIYSNLATIHAYGMLEYAIAFAGIASPLLNMGIHGAYPYFTLREKIDGINKIYNLHNLGIGVLQIIMIAGYFTGIINFKYFIAIYFSAVIALQLIISSSLKTFEKGNQSVFFDGGLFIALNLANAFIYLKFNNDKVFVFVLIFYSVILQIFSAIFFKADRDKLQDGWQAYKRILVYSLPLVMSSFLMVFFFTSPRLLVDYLYGSEKTAVYSFFFRFGSIVVLLHQSLNIFYFKKIYTYDSRVLDKYFAMFLLAIAGLSITSFIVFPVVFGKHFVILHDNYPKYIAMYWAFTILMVFWVASALFENILYRENLSLKYFKALALVIVLAVITIVVLYYTGYMTFDYVAVIHVIFFFLLVEFQCYVLRKQSINFNRTRLVNVAMLVLFIVVYYLLKVTH
jgi:O-antigen/teichoic acid export membrane protein